MLAHFWSEHHFKLGSACCLHFYSIHVCFEQKPEYFLLDPTTDAIRNESQVAMCSRLLRFISASAHSCDVEDERQWDRRAWRRPRDAAAGSISSSTWTC